MIQYILRRIGYAIPILIGVNLITFVLFFLVNSPDDIARMHLGQKHVSQTAVTQWKVSHGYDLPLFYNDSKTGLNTLTDTLFYQKSIKLFSFDFGQADSGRDISHDIEQRMLPSLMIALPTLLIGLAVNITFALLLVFFRASYVDLSGVILCIVLMSISALFYIIVGQLIFADILKLVPVSGYADGLDALKFLILPVLIGVVSGIGSGTRWYRIIFLEEINKDYVRTARSKGLSELKVLFRHVLKNALIPIITGVVVIIPMLFMGSLIMESFFGIPGLGSYVIDAIGQQDFAVVRVMVFLGTLLYIIGLILTDICYTLVDPRVRFNKA